MSADYRQAVMRDAIELGVPCVRRTGRVIALCTAVRKRVDGSYVGDARAWEVPSAGKARDIVAHAVHDEDGPRWKCAQRVETPKSITGSGADTRGATPDHPEARDWPGDSPTQEAV